MQMLQQFRSSLLCAFVIVLICSCSQEQSHQASGYVEGRYTYIATSVSGNIKQLLVTRGQKVQQGELLFTLDQQPESDLYQDAIENLKQAVAARDAVAANLAYEKITYERYKILVAKKALQQSQLDQVRSMYLSRIADWSKANANVAALNAKLAQAKWSKEQKIVRAPINGFVFDTYYRLGEYAEASQPVLSLLAAANIKVIFYVSELNLGEIHLGDTVNVKIDPIKQPFKGKISFISPEAEYTPPLIYSNETNSKLIFRIEAEFTPAVANQLHPGQPVRVTYFTHA